MQYKIYSMPHCEKCEKVKAFLKSKSINYDEVDLGDDEGVVELRKIYVKIKDKVTRTPDGQLPIPLFIIFDNGDVKAVANKLEDVQAIVNG